ncbi:MAG: DNA ligase [Colwellia sp.]
MKVFVISRLYLLFLVTITLLTNVLANEKPPIQHGINYHVVDNIAQYWVSEKLDGMRGFWNGQQLLTRKGHIIHTPEWFTKNWPKDFLDGELWLGRDKFQALISCVRKQKINEYCWQNVRFMIFDMPNHSGTFNERIKQMQQLSEQTTSPYLKMIKQFKLANLTALNTTLESVISAKGEGLMLHLGSAFYKTGRNNALMKLKKAQDAEALVIAHNVGKGKYQGMLGSLQVKNSDDIVFNIGSGFSDKQRINPPQIGSIITYKYNGKTNAGIPRFARFWRVRVASKNE